MKTRISFKANYTKSADKIANTINAGCSDVEAGGITRQSGIVSSETVGYDGLVSIVENHGGKPTQRM